MDLPVRLMWGLHGYGGTDVTRQGVYYVNMTPKKQSKMFI